MTATRFRHTKRGIEPHPIRSHVVYTGLLCDHTLIGEVVGLFYDAEVGLTRLQVKHFNGEPWPIEPLMCQVDVLVR